MTPKTRAAELFSGQSGLGGATILMAVALGLLILGLAVSGWLHWLAFLAAAFAILAMASILGSRGGRRR